MGEIMICPVCKSKKTFLFHDKVWSVRKGKVYCCKICDITFVFPALKGKAKAKFYEDYNRHLKARGVIVKKTAQEVHRKAIPLAQQRYKVINKYFREVKSVLEIGSSTGAFLSLLKNKQCFGIEMAKNNREYCLRRRFAKQGYSDLSELPKDKKFGLICMFHVFEHIEDPISFLKQCRKCLYKSGVVLVEVPCIKDPLINLYDCRAFKDFYFQPMHPYVYSPKALDYVFKKAGFIKQQMIFHQRYGLDNHLTWLSKSKPGTDSGFQKLFGPSPAYKKVLEGMQKTDTLFYVAKVN